MNYDKFKYHKNLMIYMNEHFSKKLILQFLFIPFLISLDLFLHESGHAIGWMMNGVNQFSLILDFPFKLTLYHIGGNGIIGINRITISLMGPVSAMFFSITGLIISKKYNFKISKICFQMILLSEVLQLVLPFDSDLSNIQQQNALIGLIVQLIFFSITILLIILIEKTIYTMIKTYYNSKNIMSETLIKFYEEIDNITECHNDYL